MAATPTATTATTWSYVDKIIMAPMVRIGTLPGRLMALRNGCDIVYTEEIIDKKILQTRRVVNEAMGTIDYVLPNGRIVLQTCEEEAHANVFQMGTASPDYAVRAALKVQRDFRAIDVNCGCPKRFSIQGGMGAALLRKPKTLEAILSALVEACDVPVTCKIRILDSMEETIDLVKMIESTGVACIAVHGRTKTMRPDDPAEWKWIKEVVDAVSIPVVANGDIRSREDAARVRAETGCAGAMLARALQANMSAVSSTGVRERYSVAKEYLTLCIQLGNMVGNTKFGLMHGIGSLRSDFDRKFASAKTYEALSAMWGLEEVYKKSAPLYPDYPGDIDFIDFSVPDPDDVAAAELAARYALPADWPEGPPPGDAARKLKEEKRRKFKLKNKRPVSPAGEGGEAAKRPCVEEKRASNTPAAAATTTTPTPPPPTTNKTTTTTTPDNTATSAQPAAAAATATAGGS